MASGAFELGRGAAAALCLTGRAGAARAVGADAGCPAGPTGIGTAEGPTAAGAAAAAAAASLPMPGASGRIATV